MELQRFTTEELIEQCRVIFYNHMASTEDLFVCGEFMPCTPECPTVADMLHDLHLEVLKENDERIRLYEEARANERTDKECIPVLDKQLEYLHHERTLLTNSNMKLQKETFKETGTLDFARSGIRIPLDKKINSFYDNFVLEVVFYDDVCTLKGKYEDYKKLTSFEERIDFIKKNTEITHMGLAYFVDGKHKATIGLYGNLNFDDPRVTESDITLLPIKFSDLSNLTLRDTNEIKNNDLKQFIQSLIDLDREEVLKVVADKFVGHDNYKILIDTSASNSREAFYIRYVCPSTGRPYFNLLNLENLRLSEYFDKENNENYESYIDAWWSLNNLGANPYGKAMIRC